MIPVGFIRERTCNLKKIIALVNKRTCLFFCSTGYVVGRIIFAMVGKFSVMNSFDAIFVFSAELFPTVVR